MRFRIFTLLMLLCLQASLSFADPLSDIGLFVADREATTVAWKAGVYGTHPTISGVVSGSAAEHVGLQSGDVILSVGYKKIASTAELRGMGQISQPLIVLRGMERMTLSLAESVKIPQTSQSATTGYPSNSDTQQSHSSKPAIFPQLGHSGIFSLAITPDGLHAISGGVEGNIKVWDLSAGRELRTLTGHTSSVNSVAVTPDGKYVVSAGSDSTVRVWDIFSGKQIRTLTTGEYTGAIWAVALSRDGRFVAAGGDYDKILNIYDIRSGKIIRRFSGHTDSITAVEFSPDGKFIASCGFKDKSVIIWDIAHNRIYKTFRTPATGMSSLTFSPNGKFIATGDSKEIEPTIYADGTSEPKKYNGELLIRIWDLNSGEVKTIRGHTNSISSLAFKHDGKFLLSSSGDDGTTIIWDLNSLRELKSFKSHNHVPVKAIYSTDERNVISAGYDASIRIWDVSSGKNIKTIFGLASNIRTLALSYDGKYLASSGKDNTLKLWDVAKGQEVSRFSGHTNQINTVAFSKDGRYLVSGGVDKTIKTWDVNTGKLLLDTTFLSPITSVAFSSNNKQILSTAVEGSGAIRLLDARTGKNIINYEKPIFGATNTRVAIFSPNEHYVLVGGSVSTTNMESVSTTKFSSEVNSLFSTAGKTGLQLYDANNGKPLTAYSGHTSSVLTVAFTPDGKRILSSGIDANIKLWDVASGQELRTITGHKEPVNSLYVSSDGLYVLSASSDLTSKLHEINTGKTVRTFKGHTGSVMAALISSDGKFVISGGVEGTIRYFDIQTSKEVIQLISFLDGEWIAITPEGYFNASPNGAKHLNVRVGNNVYGIDQLYATLYRPDLVQAKLDGKDISQYAANVNINTVLTQKTLPPKVRFITKPATSENPDITLQAEVCDNGGGVGDITLYLDNMPVVVDSIGRGLKAVAKGTEGCQQFEKTITLQNGSNSISLMAYNKNNTIESTRDSISITHREAITRKPTLHLLAIAVNSYRDGDLRLKYAIPDAKALAASMQKATGGLFEKVQLHTIYDAEATKEGIAETFARIGATTRREDVFLLYVAGHGITNRIDGAYYFLPYDFRYTGEDALTRQGVSENDFKKYLAQIQATKSLLLLDTCNSGSFAEAVASRGMIEKTAVNKLVRAVGRATIVASSKDQVALEGYEGHGVFTWTLLEGMNGKAASSDGRITVNNLATFVEETLPKITYKKWGYEQIPQKSLMGMDFPIGMR